MALSQLTPFTTWLAATPMSTAIGAAPWVTPWSTTWSPADLTVPWSEAQFDGDLFARVAPLVQERIAAFGEIPSMIAFFFLDEVPFDEAAFAKERTGIDLWRKNIRPTLVDYRGSALVLSNTNGISEENLLWALCNIPEYGFVEYHAPSHANPYLPRDELALIEKNTHPLVYAQEYLAEFVDFSAGEGFEDVLD